jgi:hypothetical protein
MNRTKQKPNWQKFLSMLVLGTAGVLGLAPYQPGDEIKTLRAQVATLESQVGTLKAQVATLRVENREKDQKFAKLKLYYEYAKVLLKERTKTSQGVVRVNGVPVPDDLP